MFEHPEFYDGSEDISDSTCKQYGKYIYFVTKWLRAGWDFHKTQSDDFRTQTILRDMNEEDRRDYMIGGVLFTGLPRQERIIYSLYYAEGISIPELADMFRTTTDQIEKIANRIREALQTDELHLRLIHHFVKHELRIAHHSYEGTLDLAKNLYAVYPELNAANDSVVNLADKLPVFGESLSAQLPHAIDGVAETVKSGVQQVSQIVDTVANGHVTETVATGAGTLAAAGTVKSFSAILMALAMPFLWIMSVLLCGKILGTALVREAPSFSIRRWLSKHLFISCCLGLAFPLSIIFMGALCEYIFKLNPDGYIPIIGVVNSIYFIGGIAYFGWMNRKYWRLIKIELFSFNKTVYPFESIKKFIKQGLKWLSIVTWSVCIILTVRLVWSCYIHINSGNISNGINAIIVAFVFAGGAGIILKSITLLFDYFLMISKNEESAKQIPLPLDSVNGSLRLNMIRELVYTWPFTFVVLFPSLVRLFRQARTGDALIELGLFIPWWCAVLYFNAKSSKYRWRLIFGTLIVQLFIKEMIRHVI